MILASMPDLPPRPLTTVNAPFRRSFYERWGRENALVCGRAERIEFDVHPQLLSIKAAWGGRERYLLAEREVVVDDDHWLLLEAGRSYGSTLRAPRPMVSFAVFFRPGLVGEVRAARAQSLDAALQTSDPAPREITLREHLRPQGGPIGLRLRTMYEAAQAGERSEDWLEQALMSLLDVLLAGEGEHHVLGAMRRAGREELARRLHLAADFIDSCHTEPITLDEMARVACLSRYHFVRHFRTRFGLTPYAYLLRKRARAAQRLLAAGLRDREAMAQQCGFGSRFALARALARHAPATAGTDH